MTNLTNYQRRILGSLVDSVEKERKKVGWSHFFPPETLVRIVLHPDVDESLLIWDDWGMAVPPHQHTRIRTGEIGLVLRPVRKSNTWECVNCGAKKGDKATRSHFRLILIQDVPRAIPICWLDAVTE